MTNPWFPVVLEQLPQGSCPDSFSPPTCAPARRRSGWVLQICAWLAAFSPGLGQGGEAIGLHPDNPHYFLWRGQPTVLITSGEHYGAVLNLDFDYRRYLDTLAGDGMNNTRTFTGGAYVEPQGAFNIARNTLAPAAGRYLAPWARSDQPGYAGGGNKFDLARWNEGYFERFRHFVEYAAQKGVVVEVNLFCPFYEEKQWLLSPFSTNNNVNGLGAVSRLDVYTLDKHGGLLEPQERLTSRLVEELKDFDNVYYEICNEPYFGGVTLAWQHHIAETIQNAQQHHPHPKLISRNVANHAARVTDPHPAISLFNFHYATPPDTVAMNYDLDKPLGDNETGFRGTADAPYRMEAWDFMIAGGALFNHLDYSFAAGFEDGTFAYPSTQPGGGNPGLRRQFRILGEFLRSFDFTRMRPDNGVIADGVPPGGTARALVEPSRAYAIYLRQDGATGPFSVRWTGWVVPRYSEEYTFHTFSNDGVRLWVDGRALVDDWTDHGEKEDTGTITLQAGHRYPLKLEYFYRGGQGAMKLWWSSQHQNKESIAPSQLLHDDAGAPGLRGAYFRGHEFQTPWATRVDAQVNFSWGTESPFPASHAAGETKLQLAMPPGEYLAEWVAPKTGEIVKKERIVHAGGRCALAAPAYEEDIALRIRR